MKKVLLCSLCLLVCALGINIPAVGQPSQKLVNVVVSPDRPDWKYKVGDEAVFTVQVLEAANPVKGVTVDYEVGPEFFPTVKKEGVVLKDGKMTLKAKMTEPGFARCRVVAKKTVIPTRVWRRWRSAKIRSVRHRPNLPISTLFGPMHSLRPVKLRSIRL